MSIYTVKNEVSGAKKIAVDDMILTADTPTTAGSKMLDGYVSLFEAEVLTRLKNKGYELCGKVKVGEFAFDMLGETCFLGAEYDEGALKYPATQAVLSGDALASIVLDANGAPRRATAQSGLVCLKPTYGRVSRYGTIPVACSGDTVSVIANTIGVLGEVFNDICGYDCKDGTSLPEDMVQSGKNKIEKKNKVALLTCMLKGIDGEVKNKLDELIAKLKNKGVEVVEMDDKIVSYASVAWNILMSAELCNNVSRYDGVKYGYRAKEFTSIDELYTNSRTEAFGELTKRAILFGSETLSTENYKKVYDKALRVRRVIKDKMLEILSSVDALIMPAVSTLSYTKEMIEGDTNLAFKENFYTAPASITGLPVITIGGAQLVGKDFSEELLLDLACFE